jgi:hypothetical protein
VTKGHSLGARHGYRPDFRLGDTLVEVRADLHSFRNLRAALLQLAYRLSAATGDRGVLVLVDPRITEAALKKEWGLIERTLHPAILRRLALAVRRDSQVAAIAGTLDPALAKRLLSSVDEEAGSRPYRAPQSSSPDAVLQVLLAQWFLRKGPMTTRWIMRAAGCSYPTAASALRRLGHVIRRYPDRRFQLWGFPAEEWQRVVANRERAHPTLHYADRSGQPRGAESLLRRARKLGRGDLAVGGVIAARHYYPDLDLRGTPRLDLTLHCPDGRANLAFVEQIDPALERTAGKDEHAALAIHVLRRQASLFEPSAEGLPWADPASTLLDLHDARLEQQAKGLLEHLVASVG